MAKRAQMPKRPAGSGQPKGATKTARPRRAAGSTWLLVAVIGAVALVVAGVIWLQVQSQQRAFAPSNKVGEGSAWGPADAPVKIVEYSNFGCSHCKTFALAQGKQLRLEYESTGKVRFEFKQFRLGSIETDVAANASECAADQGRFWDYHDLLFTRQGVSANPFAKSALKQYAAQLGLDASAFDVCVDKGQHMSKVYSDSDQGKAQQVTGTPTFFVNGKKLQGDVPYADFKAIVDAALAVAAK